MLTRQKKRFCDLYLSNGFNATQAAKDAGYKGKNVKQKGYRLKNDPECDEYILACMLEKEEELQIGKDEVYQLLSEKIRGKAEEKHAFTIRTGTKTGFKEVIDEVMLPIKQRDILKAIEIYARLRKWDKDENENKPTINIINDIPKQKNGGD